MISKKDFSDEISQGIFSYRKKFYEERDVNVLIKMLCRGYRDYVIKANTFCNIALKKIHKSDGEFVIYGSGMNGKRVWKYLAKNNESGKIKYFCDSNKKNKGVLKIDGVTKIIMHIDEIINDNYQFIIPPGIYQDEIYQILVSEKKCDPDRIISVSNFELSEENLEYRDDLESIFLNNDNHFVFYGLGWQSYLFRKLLYNAGHDPGVVIASRPDRVIDSMSLYKDMNNCFFIVYEKINENYLLQQKINKKNIIRLRNIDEMQYFDPEIVPSYLKEKQASFIDGGSLNLYSGESFAEWCNGKFNKIIAYEPDVRCIQECKNVIKRDHYKENVILIEKGLWSTDTELKFTVDSNLGSSSVYYDDPEHNSSVSVPVTSIDESIKSEKISFIKMDIEGAELEALKGARNTIIKYHPTLAVSVYHKPQDIVEIPDYIKSIVPEYKLYLRNYHFDQTEAVLYAIYEK